MCRASLIRSISQTFSPAFASIRFAQVGSLLGSGCRCSLGAPGTRSRRWAARLARRRTCKPRCRRCCRRSPPASPSCHALSEKRAGRRQRVWLWLAGWPRLAEGWGSLRHAVALTVAYGAPAGRGLATFAFHIGDRSGAATAPTCHLPTCLPAYCLPAPYLPPTACSLRPPPQVPQLIIESASPCKILLANHAWCAALRTRYASEDLALTPTLPLPLPLPLTRCALTGYASEDIVGRSASLLHGPLTCRETLSALGIAMASGRSLQVRYLVITPRAH